MNLRDVLRVTVVSMGILWAGFCAFLAVRGVQSQGWLPYLDNGNVASIFSVTLSTSAVVSAWHLWAERQHARRHRDLKAHISEHQKTMDAP